MAFVDFKIISTIAQATNITGIKGEHFLNTDAAAGVYYVMNFAGALNFITR
jgi:hypothetical protein